MATVTTKVIEKTGQTIESGISYRYVISQIWNTDTTPYNLSVSLEVYFTNSGSDRTIGSFRYQANVNNSKYGGVSYDLIKIDSEQTLRVFYRTFNLTVEESQADTMDVAVEIQYRYNGKTYMSESDTVPIENVLLSSFSNEDKEALANNTAAIKCKILLKETDDLPETVLTENNSVKNWEYDDERLVPNKGFIGQFVGRTLDGELQNISNDFNINGREMELRFGVHHMDTHQDNWYSFGNFIVSDPENDEVIDNTKFETMDYRKLFNKDFDGSYVSDNFPTSYNDLMGVGLTDEQKQSFVVTPVTALWVAQYTCEQVGVDLATTNFTNANFQIDINPFQAGEKCRDVMKAVGQLAFSWVRIGWDNRCYIDFAKKTTDNVDTHNVIDKNQYFSLSTKETTVPVDGVAFGMLNIDGETAFKTLNDIPVDEAKNIIYLYDNPFLYTYELRLAAVQQGSVLFGLTYTQLSSETVGHPWIIGPDMIEIRDMEDNPRYTYGFNNIIKYSGHIRSQISSMDETEIEKTLGYTSEVVRATRMASISVNKQEGVTTLLNGKVTTIEDTVNNNMYTKGQINELIANELGLTNRYITSGGANKFRNTGLWYKENNEYEFWTGSVSVVDDANSASSTAMMLQNGSVSQLLTNIPNGKYTISFKSEKLNQTATLQVLINSVDYSSSIDTFGKFEQTIDVTTNSIEIIFACNAANGWKIWELMCNVGEVALVWTQHPDEVRTDTVSISKGLTITSTTTDAVFKANADGIRIENKSKNTTTNFLEDGMETENATIKKQAKISGALHTIVGNQTWISGIL